MSSASPQHSYVWDIFISHAGPDKERYVRPLEAELTKKRLACWLDEQTLDTGEVLAQRINEGLSKSRFGLVCLSETFLGRRWPEEELFALLSRQNLTGFKCVLPLILNARDSVLAAYPLLASRIYLDFAIGPQAIAERVVQLDDRQAKLAAILDRTATLDSELSDVLAEMARPERRAVCELLERLQQNSSDDSERYWLFYTYGRIGGMNSRRLLEGARREETGLALRGVEDGLKLFG